MEGGALFAVAGELTLVLQELRSCLGGINMRKILLLGAAALIVPSVAFADGEGASASPNFVGVQAGWTQMEMPAHANGAFYMDFGGGLEPFPLTADVDGMTYGFGIGKDLSSGWRVGGYASFFDGDGEASGAFAIPNLTPFRRGSLTGATNVTANYGGAATAVQALAVDVTDYSLSASLGHALGSMLHGDLVATYAASDTEYRNDIDVTGGAFTEEWDTNTTFNTSTVALAARLSANLGLTDAFSLNLAGSAGYGIRNVSMNATQRYVQNAAVITSSALGTDDDVDGFLGRVEATLNYAIAPSTMIGLNATYAYDDMVPVYLPPDYVAATPAGIGTEGLGTMTYGVRVVGRF